MVKTLNLRLYCRGFDSRPFRFQVTSFRQVVHTQSRTCLCHQAAGRHCSLGRDIRRSGHASQTSVVYPPTGSRPK